MESYIKKTTTLHLLRRGYQLIVKWWLSVFILWEGIIRWLFKGIFAALELHKSFERKVVSNGLSRLLWNDDNFYVCKDSSILVHTQTFDKKTSKKVDFNIYIHVLYPKMALEPWFKCHSMLFLTDVNIMPVVFWLASKLHFLLLTIVIYITCCSSPPSSPSWTIRMQTQDHLTSSLKKHLFYNWLINNILYLCVT